MSSSKNNQKVAILLCGHIRTWHNTKDSFLNFIDGTDYDIFIHTYNQINAFHPYIQGILSLSDDNNLQQVSNETISNILDINYKDLVIENTNDDYFNKDIINAEKKDIPSYYHSLYSQYDDLQVLKGRGVSIRTYLQYRKMNLCNKLRKKYEQEHNIKYDYIFKTRFDMDYSKSSKKLKDFLDESISGTIITSPINSQPNDFMYICNSTDFDSLMDGYENATFMANKEYSPHDYLYQALISQKLTNRATINNVYVNRK